MADQRVWDEIDEQAQAEGSGLRRAYHSVGRRLGRKNLAYHDRSTDRQQQPQKKYPSLLDRLETEIG